MIDRSFVTAECFYCTKIKPTISDYRSESQVKNTAFVLKNCIFSDNIYFTKKGIFLSHKPSMSKVFSSKIIIYFFITNGWLILCFRSSFYSIWHISRVLPHAFISRSDTFICTKNSFIGSVSISQYAAVI